MTKKNKNIIAISIIVILIASILLTLHCAREHGIRSIRQDGNFQYLKEYHEETSDEGSLYEEEDILESELDDYDDINLPTDEEEKTRENIAKNSDKTLDKKIAPRRSVNYGRIPNREGNISTGYVTLLCIESFLLGGSVLYLIMNNMDTCEYEEIKTKKSKKTEK